MENRDKIDIVLLDMVMPRMDGGEIFDRMKKINPQIKVLLLSGQGIEGQATEILKRGCDACIEKPFDMDLLSRSLKRILGKEDKKKTGTTALMKQ